MEPRLWQSEAQFIQSCSARHGCGGKKACHVSQPKGDFPQKNVVGGKALSDYPSSLTVILHPVHCEGWLHWVLKAAQMAVDVSCSWGAQRPGFETELRSPWLHPESMLALMALLLLPVSLSFCPLRTTAALLSRGTWLRISRRSLGTCS